MFIDIGEIIGGPDAGDGPLGALLNIFTIGGGVAGAAGLAGFGGMGDSVGGGSAAAAAHAASGVETAVGNAARGSNFGRVVSDAAEVFFNLHPDEAQRIFSEFFDYVFRQHHRVSARFDRDVQEVALAHSYFYEQVKQHAPDLAEQYQKLGSSLPDEGFLRKAYHQLSKIMHTDKYQAQRLSEDEMAAIRNAAARLNASRDVLQDPQKRGAYESALRTNPKGVEEMLGDLAKAAASQVKEESQVVRTTLSEGRLLMHDAQPEARAAEEALETAARRLRGQRTMLIIGAGALVAVGVLYCLKSRRPRTQHARHPHQQDSMGQWQPHLRPNRVVAGEGREATERETAGSYHR